MSVAGWVVLGDESALEQQFEGQAEGGLPDAGKPIGNVIPPAETSIQDERKSEIPRVVNKLENPRPAEFSIREFVFACLLGSQNLFLRKFSAQ